MKTNRINKDNYLFIVKANLYLELFATGKFVFDSFEKLADDEAWRQAEKHIETIDDRLQKAYFLKAVKEIELLESAGCVFIENSLPRKDLGYNIDAYIDVPNAKELLSFCLNKETPSFLLKYLIFDFGCSDGEMTFYRLNAYFTFILNHDLFSKNKLSYPKHNILLLLDELDISLHPKAKQEFVGSLLRMLGQRFHKEHYIQIVLTSHSPIILSDIPTQNTIYLKREGNGKTEVVNIGHQTFGSDISTLYADAFYFGDSLPIGTFSKNYINDLYEEYKETGDLDALQKRIDLIGNDLIKRQFGVKNRSDLRWPQRHETIETIKRDLQTLVMLLEREEEDD